MSYQVESLFFITSTAVVVWKSSSVDDVLFCGFSTEYKTFHTLLATKNCWSIYLYENDLTSCGPSFQTNAHNVARGITVNFKYSYIKILIRNFKDSIFP